MLSLLVPSGQVVSSQYSVVGQVVFGSYVEPVRFALVRFTPGISAPARYSLVTSQPKYGKQVGEALPLVPLSINKKIIKLLAYNACELIAIIIAD